MEATIAAISRMYPEGPVYITNGGKRSDVPVLYRWRRGWKANLAGQVHLFDEEGRFISAGEGNYWTRAASLPPPATPSPASF